MPIAEAVKSLRKRLGQSQAQFAELLACQRNTVSRYELGSFIPGPMVLMQLMGVAESAGPSAAAELDVIKQELKSFYSNGLIGISGGRTFEDWIAFNRQLSGSTFREAQRASELLEALPIDKRSDFGFRQFVPAVADVFEVCDTVDQSVTDILHLWAAHSKTSESAQRFRDALGFLRTHLWRKRGTPAAPETGRTRKLRP